MPVAHPRRLNTILPRDQQRCFARHFVLEHFLGAERFERWLGGRRKHLQGQMLEVLKANGPGRLLRVPEVRDQSPQEFFRDYAHHGIPVVFKGQAESWKACREWNFDFLKERYGADPALLVNHKMYNGAADVDGSYEVIELEALINQMDQGSMKYARFHPLLDRHPELLNDLDHDWLDDRMYQKTFRDLTFHVLFMGGKGTSTPIHNAGNDNMFLQIEGRKRWHLWLPEVRYAFQPEANRGPAKSCDLIPGDPDYQRWPLYPYVDTMRVDLEPGDLLYVPAYAWHHVENLTHSIGVGTRWTALKTTFRNDPLLASLELFNTNPSMFKTMFMKGEFDFNKLLIEAMGQPAPNLMLNAPSTDRYLEAA